MNPPAQALSDPQPSRVAPRPSNAKSRPTRADTQDPRQEPIVNKNASRNPDIDEAPVPRPKQVINRRPATRSTSGERSVPVAKPIATTSTSTNLPKLSQGHKSLKQYYERANTAFEALTITKPQMEYDFISAFIAGLANKKHTEKVIQALRAVHPAKNRLEGGVEIMCGWEDVAAGFKRAGLDVMGAKEEIKRKKRTLNPRTQLETGFSALPS